MTANAIKVKATRSYYVTEVSIDLPEKVEDVDALVRELKTDGKMVVVYSGGGTQGMTVEQKHRVPDHVDSKIRNLLNLATKKM